MELCQERELMSSIVAHSDSAEQVFRQDVPRTTVPIDKKLLSDTIKRIRNYRQLPEAELALRIVLQFTAHLDDSVGPLVRLEAPRGKLIVVGDLHGHLNDLLHLLDEHGEPNSVTQYLFNGDFVDRGMWGPEVIFMLFCLRLLYPEHVHLNRGNHESQTCNENYGFKAQLFHVYPTHRDMLYGAIQHAYNVLPLCHVVGEKVFVVHGGLPTFTDSVTLAEIEVLPRVAVPLHPTDRWESLFVCLLWSDPSHTNGRSARGAGCHFSESVTRQFLAINNLSKIVRSHECVDNGIRSDHHDLITTVFSASNYDSGNAASIVMIREDLEVELGIQWKEPNGPAAWLRMENGSTWVRRSDWDDDAWANAQAVLALRQSLGSSEPWSTSPKERALAYVRQRIFMARSQLLQLFEESDDAQEGRVSLAVWCVTLSSWFGTSSEFPWKQVGEHLGCIGADGDILYVEFLSRYDTPFNRWLGDRWYMLVLGQMSRQLITSAAQEFDRLDTTRNGKLSYTQLRRLVCTQLPSTMTEAQQQDLHVFTLFRNMAIDRSGFISREEFVLAIERATRIAAQCPAGHPLLDTNLRCVAKHFTIRYCDECKRSVFASQTTRYCRMCNYDLCGSCVARRHGFVSWFLDDGAVTEPNLSFAASPRKTRLEGSWDSIHKALFILCRGNCGVRSVLAAAHGTGDGFLGKENFVECMCKLTGDKDDSTYSSLWDLMLHFAHSSNPGVPGEEPRKGLTLQDVEHGLRVIDWNSRRP
eukprot:TRINITY_DN74305_c0_g1_i1.p1 TRINITY_DN74305_c0_g1~~TRINITY_DN74305_c0_g1_i1.p1  ORF type:complete len:866 (-),score=83.70 TRINITY_DN74305_c0_g1_i1:88-2349(-)